MGAISAGLGGAGNGGCSGHHRIFNRLLCFALARLAGLFRCLFRHCTASKPGGGGGRAAWRSALHRNRFGLQENLHNALLIL